MEPGPQGQAAADGQRTRARADVPLCRPVDQPGKGGGGPEHRQVLVEVELEDTRADGQRGRSRQEHCGPQGLPHWAGLTDLSSRDHDGWHGHLPLCPRLYRCRIPAQDQCRPAQLGRARPAATASGS